MDYHRPMPTEPIPSATVILLRDAPGGLETLLIRRRQGREPFAGAWVFPGGALEAIDGPQRIRQAWPAAARRAAVRELAEEAGLVVLPEGLVPFADWTSPTTMPRRFRTWFFLSAAPEGTVELGLQEASAYRWISPRQALAAHRSQTITLFPPTWVSLVELTASRTVSQALDRHRRGPTASFQPRVGHVRGQRCFFYAGDVGYGDLDGDRPGPRHRLVIHPDGWHYERDGNIHSGPCEVS
jgi:8-oxo-dGTP pyrophosphatase MutT (NUDIX family)